jgi:hypothetical protein
MAQGGMVLNCTETLFGHFSRAKPISVSTGTASFQPKKLQKNKLLPQQQRA